VEISLFVKDENEEDATVRRTQCKVPPKQMAELGYGKFCGLVLGAISQGLRTFD
jgi:hypothetical protein